MLALVWRNLTRHRWQFALTVLSVLIAFLLFGVLMAVRHGFSGQRPQSQAATRRLTTVNRIAPYSPMPVAYASRIAAVPGVEAVTYVEAFAGFYQQRSQPVVLFAMPAATLLLVYPDLAVPPAQLEAWRADRAGVLVTPIMAKQYGWHVGDHLPIQSSIRRRDGGTTWDVTIDGLIRRRGGAPFSSQRLFMHYRYFDEARTSNQGTVAAFTTLAASATQADQISHGIDRQFANASPQTRTTSSNALLKNAYAAAGNVGAILTAMAVAVFASMLLVIGAVMLHSSRERLTEFAVLRALGFRRLAVSSLVLGESMAVCLIGGGLGLALAYEFVTVLQSALAQQLAGVALTCPAVAMAIGFMIALGTLAGVVPAAQTWRLSIREALSRP